MKDYTYFRCRIGALASTMLEVQLTAGCYQHCNWHSSTEKSHGLQWETDTYKTKDTVISPCTVHGVCVCVFRFCPFLLNNLFVQEQAAVTSKYAYRLGQLCSKALSPMQIEPPTISFHKHWKLLADENLLQKLFVNYGQIMFSNHASNREQKTTEAKKEREIVQTSLRWARKIQTSKDYPGRGCQILAMAKFEGLGCRRSNRV